MPVRLVIAGSRGVFPSVADIDADVLRLPLPWVDAPSIEQVPALIAEVIDGWADGGDYAGNLWATARGIPVHPEPITEDDIQRWGKYLAPKFRNARMADRGELGLVYWDGKSSGTPDFTIRMVLRKKPVEVVPTKILPGRPRRPRYPAPT